MIRYAFDLYPADDPKDGARIRRLSSLQSGGTNNATSGTFYQGAAKGTGSGQIMLRGINDAAGDAEDLDPDGLQYIRVVRIDDATVDGTTLSGFDELVVGGFFLDSGDFDAITESGTKLLKFGGAGAMSVLDRECMWSHTYVGAAGELSSLGSGGQDPFDVKWRLYAQGDFAGGDFLGAVLWRAVAEGMSYQNGAYTHLHADGTLHTDTHADDKTESAISMVALTFDGFTDSSGNAWTLPSGNFTAQVGESLLSVVKRLMEAGLYIEMNPDTFELSAWEAANHGRDATGLAWGTDVVRLQVSTDGDKDTGNIKSNATRAIAARIKRSALLAGGQGDVYGLATSGSVPVPWHGFYSSDAEDVAALEQIATTQVQARIDAGDTVRARFKLGDDAANGRYLPFETILLDDTASLHSGTSQWDWNEATAPVGALTISLRPGGDWDAFADLGSSYMSSGDRNFQTRLQGRAQGPTLRLCDPDTNIDCADLTDADLTSATATNGDAEDTDGTQWSGGGFQTVHVHGGSHSYGVTSATSGTLVYTFPADQVFEEGVRYVIEFWKQSGETEVSDQISFGVSGGDEEIGPTDDVAIEQKTVGGRSWGRHRLCWTPTADRTGVRMAYAFEQNKAGYWLIDDLALYTAAARGGTNGTSPRAARCDHGHKHNDLIGRAAADAHPASAVSYDNASVSSTADNVQSELDRLENLIGAEGGLGWYVVTAYGAVGDDTTDDTSAIQDAVDACIAGGGGIVYFPYGDSGVYKITSQIDIDPGSGMSVVLMGQLGSSGYGTDGATGVAIRQATTNTHALVFNDNADSSAVIGLSIRGPGGTPTSGDGIRAGKTVSTRNVHIRGFYNGLHHTGGGYYAKHYESMFTQCENAAVLADADVNNIDFYGCRFQTSKYGLKTSAVEKLGIFGGSVESNTTAGLEIDTASSSDPTRGVIVHGVYFESTATDIRIGNTSAVNGISIEGCKFTSGATWQIDIKRADGVWIAGNAIDKAKVRADASNVTNIVLGPNTGSGSYGTMPSGAVDLMDLDSSDSNVEDLPTAETDTTLVLRPDGSGGVEFAAETAITSLVPIDTGTPTYDDTDDVDVSVATVWGYDGTDAYYDSTGATSGEEAALYLDPATGDYVIVPLAA